MNRKDVVKYVSDKTMITERDAGIVYDVVIDCIKDFLVNGEEVKVRDFGTFHIQDRKPRKSVHPKDGREIIIPAKKIIKFRVSKGFNERIN